MKLRSRTVQQRLFSSYSILIAAIVLVGAATFFSILFNEIEKEMAEYNDVMCLRLANQLDIEVQRMDEVAKRIIFTPDIRDLFAMEFLPSQREERYENQLRLSEKIVNVSGLVYRVERVTLFSPGKRFLTVNGYASIEERRLEETEVEWGNELAHFQRRRLLLPPHITEAGSKGPVLSLIRELAMPFRFEGKAYVEIQQSYSVFEDIVSSNHTGTTDPGWERYRPTVYVFDEYGRLAYPWQEVEDDSIARYRELARQRAATPDGIHIRYGGLFHNESISMAYAPDARWTVLLVDTQKYMDRSIGAYTVGIALWGVLIIFLALLLSYFIARRITKPIRQVHQYIRSIDPLALPNGTSGGIRQVDDGYNEIEELNISFQNLCDALSQSVEETVSARTYLVQAKLLALQSQMNPHFLYNTLSAISIVAEDENAPQAARMTVSLSQMLNYVSSDSTELVTLETELAHTRNFLSLLKIRYEDDMDAQFDIPAEMLPLQIPKLVIQPFAENWSKYGMNGQSVCHIWIAGRREGNTWTITIRDNGPGFSPQVLEWFEAQKLAVERHGEIPDLRIHKMGILNIYVRLWFLYRDNCIFRIENLPEGGCIVTIGGLVLGTDDSGSDSGC
ncbi:histidine kinase [Ruminococcaceae bacterium OttesenSCG-928-L11]|nr:histidine kinase [Ruminococcaceae bacterium OttesenSCG-928-L11]